MCTMMSPTASKVAFLISGSAGREGDGGGDSEAVSAGGEDVCDCAGDGRTGFWVGGEEEGEPFEQAVSPIANNQMQSHAAFLIINRSPNLKFANGLSALFIA